MHLATLIVGGVFALIGAGLGASGAYMVIAGEERRLTAEGARTHAHVLHKAIHANRTSGSTVRPEYRVHYRFVPARSDAVTGSREIDATLWKRIGPGDAIEVVYLPGDPAVHRVETQPDNTLVPVVLAVLGLVFGPLGIWLIRQAYARPPPAAPAEPARSRPADRLGAWIGRSPLFALGVAGVLFFLPFAMAGVAWYGAERNVEALFVVRSLSIDGIVLEKAVIRKRSSVGNRSNATSTHHHVTYRFASDEGHEIIGTSEVDPERWERLKERGPIAVRYVAGSPWLHRLRGEGAAWTGPMIFLAIGGLGVVASAFAAVRGRARWSRNGSRRRGRAMPASAAMPRARAKHPSSPARQPSLRALAVGGVFFVAGLGACVGAALDALLEDRYASEGRIAEARITEKEVREAKRRGSTRTQYIARYRFTTADGKPADGEAVLDFRAWESTKPGDPIRVRYLEAAPQTNRAAAEDRMGESILMTLLAIVVAGIGAGVAYVGWWRPRRFRESAIH